MSAPTRTLLALARANGVQSSYRDVTGRRRAAGAEAITAVLRSLGVPIERPDQADAVARARPPEDRLVEPVAVAWDGRHAGIELRLGDRPPARVRATMELEGGEERAWEVRTGDARTGDGVATLRLDGALPLGRHGLTVEDGRRVGHTVVLSAPSRVPAANGLRDWGVFVPLHALTTERSWGTGDLTGLGELADRIRELGGGLVATLPLLAAFPGEASPYRPASRLFWNERYVDVAALPELEADPETRRLVSSVRFRRELDAVREGELVDLERVSSLKRRVLERLARALEERGGDRAAALRRFLRANPAALDYARFRAAGERLGLEWRRWPAAARRGRIGRRDLDPDAVRYHAYVQWVAEEQVAELGRRARSGGAGLCLDLPIGVHPDGYDVWRHGQDFAAGVSVGAPPDDFFTGGQDWGSPPLHPERVREDGYAYPMACLRHTFRHAGVARVDHAMGLHRQYWVPEGFPADQGVFVRYAAEEWYAAIALEAHRTDTVVVGEDLGTVPAEVRTAMRRHGMLRSYVLQFAVEPDRDPAVVPPSGEMLASVNTHDMPPFASFWRRGSATRDAIVRVLVERGLLRRDRRSDTRKALAASLEWLAGSDAALVVVNLEDLWLETRSQNVPGTSDPRNWRRRAARSLEQITASRDVLDVLARVEAARRGALERGDAA